MATKSEPLTAKQLAIQLGTDARTTRKFLRAKLGLVGQGKRWEVGGSKKEVEKMKKDFAEWQAANLRPKSSEDDESTEPTTPTDGDEPTFDDLEEIEDLDLDDD